MESFEYCEKDYEYYHDLIIDYLKTRIKTSPNKTHLKKYKIVGCGYNCELNNFEYMYPYVTIIFIDIFGNIYSTVNGDASMPFVTRGTHYPEDRPLKLNSRQQIKKDHLNFIIKNDLIFNLSITHVFPKNRYSIRSK